MSGFFITLALFFLFVFLFFWQDRLDRKRLRRRELEGDLHVLREMRRFLFEKGMNVSPYESAIAELERQLNG